MKYLFLMLLITGCATNQHDADIAKAKFEYGTIVNAQNKILEITCSVEEKQTGKCGVFGEFIVYQSNQRYIDVDPQKKGITDHLFNLAGLVLPSFLQYKIADSGNKWAFKGQESSNNMFKGMFADVANLKNTGTTTTYTDSNNDYSQTSSIADSYNSSDTSISDSYNTTSGDSLADSYNAETNTSTNTETNTETNTTQGDTTSTDIIPVP